MAESLFRNINRRNDPRYAARVEVNFASEGEAAKAFRAWSLNFSTGGLCLKVKHERAVGDHFKVSLTIEGEAFDLEGVVAWSRGDTVGVRFVNLSSADRARLRQVAQSLSRTSPPLP
jgi:uncharacterized protein (TIGR02266 family)